MPAKKFTTKLQGLQQIDSLKKVRRFMKLAIGHIGLCFHPDTPFGEYTCADETRLFSDEEAAICNGAMTTAFEFAERENLDIYKIGLAIIKKTVQWMIYNFLPSK